MFWRSDIQSWSMLTRQPPAKPTPHLEPRLHHPRLHDHFRNAVHHHLRFYHHFQLLVCNQRRRAHQLDMSMARL